MCVTRASRSAKMEGVHPQVHTKSKLLQNVSNNLTSLLTDRKTWCTGRLGSGTRTASGVYRHRSFCIEIDVPAFNAHRKVGPWQHKTTR